MMHPKEGRRGLSGKTSPTARDERRHKPSRTVYPRPGRKSTGRPVFTVTPQGTRAVGRLERRGDVLVLVKHVNRQKHLLKFPEESWGVDEDAVLRAQAAGATRVEIADERGARWWVRLAYFLEVGDPFDRGHGRQVRLPLRLWSFHPGPLREVADG